MLHSCPVINKETIMFVYVWKHNDTPFYIGLTKEHRRTNPLNSGGRGWLCKQMLDSVGRENVVTEIHTAATLEEGQALERRLIESIGRIQLKTGPLTNLRPGGDGTAGMSEAGKQATSLRMKTNNPAHNPATRAKITARMNAPDVKEKFTGKNNPAKRPEVRAKLKAKWDDPAYKEARRLEKIGKAKHSEEHKQKLREKLLDKDNPMREYHKVLNSDPAIKAKRNAALQSAEVRAKISAALKTKWAERKAIMKNS
jgi:hypothetical protein